MNCLLALLALCCLSAIQPVPIEKRFTQNFYAPVYRQDQAKLVVVHNSNLMTQHDSTKNYNKGAKRFKQSFNAPIMNQQNIEVLQSENFFGTQIHKVNIDNSKVRIPQYQSDRLVVRPRISPNDRLAVRPRERKFKRDLENQMVKRGFNQQFNGPIGSQQNIENYLKQDYFGSIMKQVNVDNSRQYKRSVKKSPFNRSLENQIIKRDFNQQYHGNIQTQQNIENYNKQDYWGSIQTQLNVDNSKSNNQVAPQPSVRPDVRPTVRPDVRPTVRPEVRPSPGLVVNHNVKPEESVSITNVVNNNQITVVKKGRKNGRKDKNRGSKNRGNKNDKGHGHRHGGNKWRNGNRNNYHGGNKHRGNNRWGNRWNNNFRYRRYRW